MFPGENEPREYVIPHFVVCLPVMYNWQLLAFSWTKYG